MSEMPNNSNEPTPRTWTAEGAMYYAHEIRKAHLTITSLYRDLVLSLEGKRDAALALRDYYNGRIDEETSHLEELIYEAFGVKAALTRPAGEAHP